MLRSVRRAAALVVAPALATFALVAVPSSATAAADPSPAAAGSGWLAAQPTNGMLSYLNFGFDTPDPGLTIDAALALQEVGGTAVPVGQIRDAIIAELGSDNPFRYGADYDYYYPEQPDPAAVRYTGHSANARAKSLAFLSTVVADPTNIGGMDLVSLLEDVTTDAGPAAGRISDDAMKGGAPYPAGDYANVLGQAFAVRALNQVSSPEAPAATAYLLAQQCSAGFFAEVMPAADSAQQTCDGTAGKPSIDATALAVLSLLPQAQSPAVLTALTKAATWLVQHQTADGAFRTDGDFGANANSTGLATWALGKLSAASPSAAAALAAPLAKGAVWVRNHQVTGIGTCQPVAAATNGAIAYDDADLAAGITDANEGKWLRATTQALPALRFAPAGAGTNVLFTAEYVRAGTTPSVGVIGAAPGDKLCATTVDGQKILSTADANGEAQFQIKLGTKTANTVVTVANAAGVAGTATIKALGAKKLPISLKAKVKKGKVQKVTVRGLAAGESVKVKVLGKTKRGQANKKGVFTASAKATGKPRKVKVTVTGEFGNRSGTKTFKVVR